jgi:CheY-like chemotaxis protein/Mn-dependent DtxR family transcriptional regulator
VNQVFLRSEQLADKIYETKLYINEWKVLFALDGKMNNTQLAEFLEVGSDEVKKAIVRLKGMGLIIPESGGMLPTEGSEIAAEPSAEVEKGIEQGRETIKEKTIEEELREFSSEALEVKPEAPIDTASLLDEIVEEVAPPATEPEKPAAEETAEPLPFEFPTIEEKVPEEEIGEDFEELKLEEETAKKSGESDQDLDSLINDLLKEETSGTESEKGPQILDESEIVEWETGKDLLKETELPAESETSDLGVDQIFETGEVETPTAGLTFDTEVVPETEEVLEEEKIEMPSMPTAAQKTILVVDDSIVIRKMVEIALENENYSVVSVATGKEAFSFLDGKDPDLVILDIMLPDVNGLDILKVIKTKKNIPVVMLSAKDTPKETAKAKELGANDFIPKPFRDEELINKIHELIGQ